jgi:hypothetical protein
MRAMRAESFTGYGGLKLVEVPRPRRADGRVLGKHFSQQQASVHLIDAGQFLALPSNQPVGFELPCGAGDQDFDDGDGGDRE